MPTYRRAEPENKDPYKAQPLPVRRPVAVYYRQSSEAQIGNISTTLQTVDMVEHLVRLGWAPESVIMIDMDAGISGMKTIQERPGMSRLYDMIENQAIGAVAVMSNGPSPVLIVTSRFSMLQTAETTKVAGPVGVSVGGTGVSAGGTGVSVGGTGVSVGETGVSVGGIGVSVGREIGAK